MNKFSYFHIGRLATLIILRRKVKKPVMELGQGIQPFLLFSSLAHQHIPKTNSKLSVSV